MSTIRPLRIATTAAVPNQPMTKIRPIVPRNELHKLTLNLLRILLTSQTESLGQASDVRIDYNSGVDVKSNTQNDVRRFSSHSGEGGAFLHRGRYFADDRV